jgi:hypothetical protein
VVTLQLVPVFPLDRLHSGDLSASLATEQVRVVVRRRNRSATTDPNVLQEIVNGSLLAHHQIATRSTLDHLAVLMNECLNPIGNRTRKTETVRATEFRVLSGRLAATADNNRLP